MTREIMFEIMRVLKRDIEKQEREINEFNNSLKGEEHQTLLETLNQNSKEEIEKSKKLIEELNKQIKKEFGKTYEEYFKKPSKKIKKEF